MGMQAGGILGYFVAIMVNDWDEAGHGLQGGYATDAGAVTPRPQLRANAGVSRREFL
jgi:hypothetical protein